LLRELSEEDKRIRAKSRESKNLIDPSFSIILLFLFLLSYTLILFVIFL